MQTHPKLQEYEGDGCVGENESCHDASQHIVECSWEFSFLETMTEHTASLNANKILIEFELIFLNQSIYLSWCSDDESTSWECQIVAGIKSMPQSAECECKNSWIFLVDTLVDDHSQPNICAKVPAANAISHVGAQLQIKKENIKIKKKLTSGSAEIWTRIVGFKVQSANHYTTEPLYAMIHALAKSRSHNVVDFSSFSANPQGISLSKSIHCVPD